MPLLFPHASRVTPGAVLEVTKGWRQRSLGAPPRWTTGWPFQCTWPGATSSSTSDLPSREAGTVPVLPTPQLWLLAR